MYLQQYSGVRAIRVLTRRKIGRPGRTRFDLEAAVAIAA